MSTCNFTKLEQYCCEHVNTNNNHYNLITTKINIILKGDKVDKYK